MRTWQELSADYGAAHRSKGNSLCHAVGIPLIALCVVRWTQLPGTAVPLIALVLPLYAWWQPALALTMTAVLILMAAAASVLPAPVFPVLFAAGWTLQLVGHARFERNRPAFSRQLVHLLVGPLWLLSKIAR